MNYKLISQQTGTSERQVRNTIQLLRDGATLPFIARYRKEATEGLDEVQIGAVRDTYQKFLDLEKRQEAIVKALEAQGVLTADLRSKIAGVRTLSELEDVYLPFKQKRKTRASLATEKGLEPLAKAIFVGWAENPVQMARKYLTSEVPDEDAALQGARDIIAEWMNENAEARRRIRILFQRDAVIVAKVKKNKAVEGEKYQDYFDFAESLKTIPSHRLLALRRGEEEGILSVSIAPDEAQALMILGREFLQGPTAGREQLELAAKDSYKRLLKPAIETEFANSSREKADEEAIQVFSENLRQLLLAPPLGQKRVLAIDPGYRTGCKVVTLDEQGSLKSQTVVYPFDQPTRAHSALEGLMKEEEIEAVAIGNGTAGRETEEFVRKVITSMGKKADKEISVYSVSEQGASIYSASEVAREEFPGQDVTVRGAISIGRRLMDPLAELVKIDPKSIGVGQYQYDVNQTSLKNTLDTVVESCVNAVGVNLNTASKHLLRYVSGLGPALAQNIVDYRSEIGGFTSRAQLMKVPRLGGKAFEQAAGFLRVKGAKNPLDDSAVHPERYSLVSRMAGDARVPVNELLTNSAARAGIQPERYVSEEIGLPTIQDILRELEKPSRDPRADREVFAFDESVKKIEDLKEGMVLPGIVTNITAFGAFVDIGVKQDGLVHISQLANQFVKDPHSVVKLQQVVRVKVLEVQSDRKRIALTMKGG